MQHTFSFNSLPAVGGEDGMPGQSDAAKHRRSRNGCFTCRTRRIKCDEARPKCKRCATGKRECLYPAETPGHQPRPARASPAQKSPNDQVLATTEAQSSPEMHNQMSPPHSFQSGEKAMHNHSSEIVVASVQETNHYHTGRLMPGSRESSSLSSSVTPSEVEPLPRPIRSTGIQAVKTRRHKSDLSASERFYLDYQKKNMSNYHYGLNTDSRGFIHKFLIDSALNSDALLQAVVAFAAYHYAIRHNGNLQDFLKPYSDALSLLRKSLGSGKPPDVTDLLTMLQLSALEEALGDWVNLQSHQKAAYAILTSLYDANTLTQNDTGNRLLEWFIRFDLITAFISGSPSNLSRDWHEATHRYFLQQSKEFPHDLAHKYDERGAAQRVLAQDVASLFQKAGKVPPTEFRRDAMLVSRGIATWYRDLPPAVLDPYKVLTDYPHDLSPCLRTNDGAESIVVYGEDLWPTNHMMVHFWSLELMFNHHLAMIQGEPTPPDVTNIALKICQMFEAIQQRDPTPGALLGVQAASGMSVPFLKKDPEMIMWGRSKQALIERSGYVYPAAYRTKMSEAWGVDVMHWWLPNDEGFLPILQQIRSFIEYRTTPTKDRSSERLREMAGIFEALGLGDLESAGTPNMGTPTSGIGS